MKQLEKRTPPVIRTLRLHRSFARVFGGGMQGAASRFAMHFLPFALKRGHYAAVKATGLLASEFDLTPARFDLIYCARNYLGERHQSSIARALGVSRSTVCKMLGAMEKAGLLVRVPLGDDRRKRGIRLTRYGSRCYKKLFKLVHRARAVERALRLANRRWWDRKTKLQELLELDDFAARVSRLAQELGGRWRLRYPSGTDYLDPM